jgi:hypothetical protein
MRRMCGGRGARTVIEIAAPGFTGCAAWLESVLTPG